MNNVKKVLAPLGMQKKLRIYIPFSEKSKNDRILE